MRRFFQKLIDEISNYKTNPYPLVVAIIMPIAAWIVLFFAFTKGNVDEIPTVIIDKSNSSLSRLIIAELDATQAINVVLVTTDEQDAEKHFRQQKSFFMINIAPDLEKRVKSGGSSQIIVTSNGANLLFSRVGYRTLAQTIVSISSGIQIKRLIAKGFSPEIATARAVPITTQYKTLGNPFFDYAIYLLPGMAFALMQMAAFFSAIWFFRKKVEDDDNNFPAKGQMISFFLVKFIPLFLANLFSLLVLLVIIFPLIGMNNFSAYPGLLLAGILFITASMGMGALVSLIMKNVVDSIQIGLVLNAPAFVFSGYTFPRWAVPELLAQAAKILPLAHLLDAYFPIYYSGINTCIGILPLIILNIIFWGLTWIVVIIRRRKLQIV